MPTFLDPYRWKEIVEEMEEEQKKKEKIAINLEKTRLENKNVEDAIFFGVIPFLLFLIFFAFKILKTL